MSVLFNHACRYELFDRNPIHLVRQSAKRRRAPTVLMPTEIKVLVDNLSIRERTLVLLAVSTGLRQSELFGLKWGDIDFAQGTMNVTRSIVYGVVGPCKTESSQKPVPVHPLLADTLSEWRKQCAYTTPDDWVFASRCYRGRRPYWGQAILRKYVRPVAQRVGIQKCIGWHTFRHYVPCLTMSRNGEPLRILPGEITSPPAKPADMTRHSFLLAADSSGRRGVSPQVYSDPVVHAARMFSPKLSPSWQSSLPDEFVGFELVRDQAQGA